MTKKSRGTLGASTTRRYETQFLLLLLKASDRRWLHEPRARLNTLLSSPQPDRTYGESLHPPSLPLIRNRAQDTGSLPRHPAQPCWGHRSRLPRGPPLPETGAAGRGPPRPGPLALHRWGGSLGTPFRIETSNVCPLAPACSTALGPGDTHRLWSENDAP